MRNGLASKAASVVATGFVGAAAFELARKAIGKLPLREASVTATAAGLRSVRKAEVSAERARLGIADVIAEARERIGEESMPPAADAGSDHHHDH